MQSDPDRLYEIWQRLKNLSPQELPQSANTNELLLENVTRLFEAYEHSPAGYVNLDKRGRIVSSNLTFCSLIGVYRAELIDRNIYDFVIRSHRDRLYLHLRNLLRTGVRGHCELQLETADKHWVRFDSLMDTSLTGRPIFRSTVVDISDQKAAEETLQRLAAVVEASEEAILLLAPDGVITDWNPAAERIYGYSRRQAVGRHADFLVPPERAGEIGELILRLRRGKKIHNRQTTRRCRDGRELSITLTLSAVLGDSGEITAVSSIERDLSGRHRREQQIREYHEQLQMAARAAGLGVWNYNMQHGESQWNKQLYHLLGLQPQEGPEDAQRFFEFIHPEDRAGSIENLQAILRKQEDEIKEEFRIVRADGKVRWLASRGRIYRDESGRPVRISGINYDITDRKRDEENVRVAHFQLAAQLSDTVRVNEELSQYAYAVSHDLKGPLRAIRNYVDFLSEDLAGTLSGDQKKYLEGLKTAVKQGDVLIEDLLSFSRLDAVPLEPEAAEMPGLIEEVRLLLDLPAEVQMDAETKWPQFTVDRTLLKQILQNLVSNAVKFNRSTAKRVDIGWQPATGDRIEIFVRDNGIGIEPQYREQVFRIFQRLHTDKDYEGTGIGLAIVQKAAQKLGGSVRLESEPGTGSTFFVALPRGGIDQRQPPESRDRASANFAPDD